MAIIIRQASNVLLLTQTVIVSNASTVPMYGSVERADNYFSQMLEGQRWMHTDHLRKQQALISATRRIDKLNFIGAKAESTQSLQFPRGTDTTVPAAIEQACFELAQELLKGVDPNTERDNSLATVQAFGQLRSEFDRSSVLPYIVAGIPSATAWDLLFPYLLEQREMRLTRVS